MSIDSNDLSKNSEHLLETFREMLHHEMPNAVSAGIRTAVSDPALWADLRKAFVAQAHQEAGGWLIGGLKMFFGKILLFVVVGMIVYMWGGWSALVGFFKSAA